MVCRVPVPPALAVPPTYVWLSVYQVSSAVCVVRASALAFESSPLPFWLRNEGMAMAARIPMIRITTRSSMSVKPSSPLRRLRRVLSTVGSSSNEVVGSSDLDRPRAAPVNFFVGPCDRPADEEMAIAGRDLDICSSHQLPLVSPAGTRQPPVEPAPLRAQP